jgi:DNA-binding transcriptional ArsR family regulator
VGWAAAKELAHFLDDVLAEITRVAFQPIRARVAHHLLTLSDSEKCEPHAIHQAELAAAVGSVREVVGRTLGALRDAGLVEISQLGITAVNEEGLRRVAGHGARPLRPCSDCGPTMVADNSAMELLQFLARTLLSESLLDLASRDPVLSMGFHCNVWQRPGRRSEAPPVQERRP